MVGMRPWHAREARACASDDGAIACVTLRKHSTSMPLMQAVAYAYRSTLSNYSVKLVYIPTCMLDHAVTRCLLRA
eukprot:5250121-Pleurochrysis_carterae.AAC.3